MPPQFSMYFHPDSIFKQNLPDQCCSIFFHTFFQKCYVLLCMLTLHNTYWVNFCLWWSEDDLEFWSSYDHLPVCLNYRDTPPSPVYVVRGIELRALGMVGSTQLRGTELRPLPLHTHHVLLCMVILNSLLKKQSFFLWIVIVPLSKIKRPCVVARTYDPRVWQVKAEFQVWRSLGNRVRPSLKRE